MACDKLKFFNVGSVSSVLELKVSTSCLYTSCVHVPSSTRSIDVVATSFNSTLSFNVPVVKFLLVSGRALVNKLELNVASFPVRISSFVPSALVSISRTSDFEPVLPIERVRLA